jgi:Photosynthesis system II assembly factor YCF48
MEELSFMASQRHDKTTTELIRRSLANDSLAGVRAPNEECPDPELLAAYFERSLGAEHTARYELHFSQCAHCREHLAAMDRAVELDAASERKTRHAANWSWLWDWRSLAPVAAALILATIWIARRPSTAPSARQRSETPLVAMSQPAEPPADRDMKEAAPPATGPAASARSGTAPASRVAPNPILDKAPNALARETTQLTPSTNERANLPTNQRKDEDSNLAKKTANAPLRASGDRNEVNDIESKASAGVSQSVPPPSPRPASPSSSQTGTVGGAMAEAKTDTRADDALQHKQLAAPTEPRRYAQKYDQAAPAIIGKRTVAVIVHTLDPKVLWQLAEQGVLKSEDGGATWQEAELPVTNGRFTSIAAPAAAVCWLVGRGGIVLLTTDGAHWQTIAPPAPVDFVQVVAENASSATVTTSDGRSFQTRDGGKHWLPKQ